MKLRSWVCLVDKQVSVVSGAHLGVVCYGLLVQMLSLRLAPGQSSGAHHLNCQLDILGFWQPLQIPVQVIVQVLHLPLLPVLGLHTLEL